MQDTSPGRVPIAGERLRAALRQRPFYVDVDTSAATGSTNADVASLARAGAPEGTVRTTDHQVSGRGRLARSWTSPPGAGLAVSVLLRPSGVPRDRWTWVPLLTGLVVAQTVAEVGVGAALKWPNDVLVSERKIAGILVEAVGAGAPDALVVGIGLNVTNTVDEVPPGGTSLALLGASALDRELILADLLRNLADAYVDWCNAAGDSADLRVAYAACCTTIGREVRVELPGGRAVHGRARAIDVDGRLVVKTTGGEIALGAGDVIQVR